MGGDPELLRLRALARSAEDRYWRLKENIRDAAVLKAAREMWTDAEAALQRYSTSANAAQERERNGTDV